MPQGFFFSFLLNNCQFSFLLNNCHFSLELLLPRIDLHVYLNYFFNYTYYLYCLLILLNFVCLLGKYFLVDCGFPNRRKFLAPFRSVRYHLQDFAGQGRDPENEKELCKKITYGDMYAKKVNAYAYPDEKWGDFVCVNKAQVS